MNHDPSTPNYLVYVLAAYLVAFALISVMFITSYRRYIKIKRRHASLKSIPDDLAPVPETELPNL